MKRQGKIYQNLTDFSNLLQAYKKARKAANGSLESQEFTFHLESKLLKLQKELRKHTWTPLSYRHFTIYEPKKRQISAAAFRDRIVHHAIIQMIEPIFETSFIYHSYATRKGKGVHVARRQAQTYLKRYPYFLKLDFDAYFASINHQVLLQLLKNKVKDEHLIALLERIIIAPNPDQSGLPIGNLTSQFFGNVYLNPLDHFIKEELRIKGYLRYMDDLVLFANNKHDLKDALRYIDSFAKGSLCLSLKERATLLGNRKAGLSFLGARIFKHTIRIKRENFRRTKQRLEKAKQAFMKGEIDEERYQAILNGHFACLEQYDSLGIRQQFVRELLRS